MSSAPILKTSSDFDEQLSECLARTSLRLARLLADKATLWCVSPARPDHAHHVAVEFIHPVVVGKPALPAVAVATPDPVVTLRQSTRVGDVILALGPGDDEVLADIAQRAPAWGVTMMWIGWGESPSATSCAIPIWLESDEDAAIVRAYHLLWELTHVCLEHRAVVASADAALPTCSVCADDLILGEVIRANTGSALVRTATGTANVETSLIDQPESNDLILLHAGVALRFATESRR